MMWGNIRVTTVIPFERHVHLNISFSSTPCFLISSNCPLYKINHFGFTSVLTFFFLSLFPLFPRPELPAGKSNLRFKMWVELWCSCALPSVAPVNQNEKNGPRFCLVFMCRSGPPGWCIRPSCCRAGIQAKLVDGRNAWHARSWIFDAGVCRINLTKCNLSSQCVCAVAASAYLHLWLVNTSWPLPGWKTAPFPVAHTQPLHAGS